MEEAKFSLSKLGKKRKAVLLVALADIYEEKNKKERSCWVKSWRSEEERAEKSAYFQLLNELKLSDSESYRGYIRMDTATFLSILKKIEPAIKKQDTFMRTSISPGERLSLTLRYLATGETFRSLEYQYRLAHNTVSAIVPEVLDAIYNAYKDEYLKTPTTQSEWLKVAEEFEEMWQFPHCLGAVDGKHIRILCPKNSGSAFYNYKGFYSIVMMAAVRADLSFIYVDAGTNGRQSDSSIWNASLLKEAIDKSCLNFPHDKPLHSGRKPSPYVFVCDEGIGMSSRIMRPYSSKELTTEKSIFNYRLSRARRVAENAFGILSCVWRVFSNIILLSPEKATKVVLTCCVLHNMLRARKVKPYLAAPNTQQANNSNCFEPLHSTRNMNAITTNAKAIREEFTNYFMTDGQVEWQWKEAISTV